MKNETIKKINIAGLIGYILSILLIIATIAGMVVCAIGTAAAVAVAKEQVEVTVSTDVQVSATDNILKKLNTFIGLDGVDDLNDLIGEADQKTTALPEDGDLSEIDIRKTENGLDIHAKTDPVTFSAKKIIAALVLSFCFLGAATVMLYMLKALMKELKGCETPFTDPVIKYMTRFAGWLIPSVVLYSACDSIWSSLTTGQGFGFTLDIGGILIVAVVFLLVVVFKHGAQLQKESDETL